MNTRSVGLFHVAVVGGGGAGLAAAIRSAMLGLKVVHVTRGTPGGRLRCAQAIRPVDSFPVGLTGDEMVDRAVAQMRRLGVVRVQGEVVALGMESSRPFNLVLTGGTSIEARAVIAATGADRCLESVDGSDGLLGAGVYTHAPGPGGRSHLPGDAFVTGTPEDAARAALSLSRSTRSVTVAIGGGADRGSLSRETRLELHRSRVALLSGWSVVAVDGVGRLEVVVLRNRRTGGVRVRTAGSLWMAGVERPRVAWLPDSMRRDPSGRVARGQGEDVLSSESSIRGVFAAGDARAGAPCGVAVLEDGVDAADQVAARLCADQVSSRCAREVA